MNTWQSYVDLNLVGAGLEHAAILGYDGQVWACSAGFAPSLEEITVLHSLFDLPLSALRYGFILDRRKYFTLYVNAHGLLGRRGSRGCVCIKTPEELVIGVYNEELHGSKALKIVETFTDYLRILSF
ncbi:profilin [Pseudomonas akapageensis]|uniref:profilin n=1 Tax=Pseudomonas akapageensis TaxID=2609961 RepID=UPI00140CB2E6|nr:profilin [Pseudomonas akapageensis]